MAKKNKIIYKFDLSDETLLLFKDIKEEIKSVNTKFKKDLKNFKIRLEMLEEFTNQHRILRGLGSYLNTMSGGGI